MTEIGFVENRLDTDYKAELLVAMMVEDCDLLEQIRIVRQGVAREGKNVSSIKKVFSRDELREFVNVNVRKRDLYESLPEGMFHKMPTGEHRTERMFVEAIKRTRQEAFNARMFFRPFEMAIDRISALAQLYEVRMEKKEQYDEFVALLSSHWSVLQNLPTSKALLLVHFITHCHQFFTWESVSQLLSMFYDCEVKIEQTSEQHIYEIGEGWNLGDGALGECSALGTMLTLMVPVVRVSFNKLEYSQKILFYENSEERRRMNKILDLFVPADAEVEVELNASTDDSSFCLADEQEAPPILGFTTILN